jgi:hypothetical protein
MQTYENPDIDPQTWTWTPGQFTHRYGQEFSYDPSGNILSQDRLDHTGSSSGLIDELEYHYYPGTNRLEYVDNHQTGGGNNQVPIQDPGNYEYDGSGNLIFDNSTSGFQTLSMDWTPNGKLHQTLRSTINSLQKSRFGYDAGGQRIKKQVISETYGDPSGLPSGGDPNPQGFPMGDLLSSDTTTLWYIRDATGNVLAVYEQVGDTITWTEQHLYGSSRLGMVLPGVKRYPGDGLADGPYFIEESKEQPYGARRYEISNHLGNVTTVVSDRKVPIDDGGSITYEAAVHSAMDYYPFGSLMTERTFSAGFYRYGFNTQEKVDEVKGSGNHYSAQFWEYDPRVVHRWNIDPRPNPSMSPYAILGGNPIMNTDWAGDTTRIYNEVGEFQFSIFDNLPNEDHFLDKGLLPLAESLTNYEGDPNEIGELLRANSEFFIGPNTREQMRSLQKLHETEAGFVLSPNDCRELMVCDITHLSNRPPTTNSIYIQPGSIRSYFSQGEYSSLVGFGHTHLGSSSPSGARIIGPNHPGDYSSMFYANTNSRPRHLSVVSGSNDFSIYTSFESHFSRSVGRWIPTFTDRKFKKIRYDGQEVR